MADQDDNQLDRPESMALDRDRFEEIGRTLATDAIVEVEDARGFPILDRDEWEGLRTRIAAEFADTMHRAYVESLRRGAGERGAQAATDRVADFASKLRRSLGAPATDETRKAAA